MGAIQGAIPILEVSQPLAACPFCRQVQARVGVEVERWGSRQPEVQMETVAGRYQLRQSNPDKVTIVVQATVCVPMGWEGRWK